ncbi:hypothetical protein DFH06DRAFT_1133323 [Mycena polygramma]|nr:hypothetical protein DFH06DRAFT_1133323 [Mycena polygramma]
MARRIIKQKRGLASPCQSAIGRALSSHLFYSQLFEASQQRILEEKREREREEFDAEQAAVSGCWMIKEESGTIGWQGYAAFASAEYAADFKVQTNWWLHPILLCLTQNRAKCALYGQVVSERSSITAQDVLPQVLQGREVVDIREKPKYIREEAEPKEARRRRPGGLRGEGLIEDLNTQPATQPELNPGPDLGWPLSKRHPPISPYREWPPFYLSKSMQIWVLTKVWAGNFIAQGWPPQLLEYTYL